MGSKLSPEPPYTLAYILPPRTCFLLPPPGKFLGPTVEAAFAKKVGSEAALGQGLCVDLCSPCTEPALRLWDLEPLFL